MLKDRGGLWNRSRTRRRPRSRRCEAVSLGFLPEDDRNADDFTSPGVNN
jgi:hypothetical protein